MKRHKRDEREMRDRRRKQVLRRIQDDEWKEQRQDWKIDDRTIHDIQLDDKEGENA